MIGLIVCIRLFKEKKVGDLGVVGVMSDFVGFEVILGIGYML